MSNHAASAPEWLTSGYVEGMLKEFFKDDSLSVEKIEILSGSSIGENYVSQIFRINAECFTKTGKRSIGIIAKVMPNTDLSKELNKDLDIHKIEERMLGETLPLMREKLLSHNEKERFFPFLYKLDSASKMIFMEDLKAEGYEMVDRKTPLDLEHTLMAIKSLAKMHAAGYLILQDDSSYKDKYLDYLWKKDVENNFMKKITEGSLSYLIKALDTWPISEDDKKIFRNFQGNMYDKMADAYVRKETSFNVILHGDCWLNNMMFKYENEKLVAVKLIDYQICNYNSIGLDLNYFLFTSSDNEVKLKHLEKVFETYYKIFTSITGNIKNLTIDIIWKEFIERLFFGFVCGAIFRAGIMAPKPFDLDAYVDGRDSPSNLEMYKNEKYIQEIVEILPLFKKYGIFK